MSYRPLLNSDVVLPLAKKTASVVASRSKLFNQRDKKDSEAPKAAVDFFRASRCCVRKIYFVLVAEASKSIVP